MSATKCSFWDCGEPIRRDHVVCRDHFPQYADGLLDECPGCGRLKSGMYDVCLDCYNGRSRAADDGGLLNRIASVILDVESPARPGPPQASGVMESRPKYRIEWSESWDAGDAAGDGFYTYILKLDDGSFYAGQTRDLQPRLMEHRDGTTKATAGREPRLVWFAQMRTRQEAATLEAELKELIDRNPREIRKMIVDFRNILRNVDTES